MISFTEICLYRCAEIEGLTFRFKSGGLIFEKDSDILDCTHISIREAFLEALIYFCKSKVVMNENKNDG